MIPVSVKTTCKHCNQTIVAASMNEYKQHNCRATFEKRSIECKISNCGRKFFGSHSLKFHQKISHYKKPYKDVLSLAMRDINNEESSNVTKNVTSVTEPSFHVTQPPLQETDVFKLVSPATQTPSTTISKDPGMQQDPGQMISSQHPGLLPAPAQMISFQEQVSISTQSSITSHTELPQHVYRASANILRKAGRQSSKTGFSTSYTTSTTTFTNTNSFAQNSSDQGLGHLVSCRNNLGNALSNSVKLSEEQPQQQLKLSQHLKLSEEEPQHQLKLSEEQLQQHLKLSEEQTQQHLKLTEEQPQQQSSHLVLQQPQGGDQQQAFTILRGQPVSQTDYLRMEIVRA